MAGKLKGEIVSVAENGNLISDISASQLDGVPRDSRVLVKCDGHVTAGIYPAEHGQPEMTLLAILDRRDVLELTLVGESASAFLGIKPGAAVNIAW